jgi:hypothetical protein
MLRDLQVVLSGPVTNCRKVQPESAFSSATADNQGCNPNATDSPHIRADKDGRQDAMRHVHTFSLVPDCWKTDASLKSKRTRRS